MGKPKSDGRLPLTSCQCVAAVVAAHHVPVLLHVQHVGRRRVHRDAVHAVPDLGVAVGDAFGVQTAVRGLPRLAAVVGAEHAGRRDRDEHAVGVGRIDHDRVQAHAAGARLPRRPRTVLAQSGELVPLVAAVDGAEQRRVLDAGEHRVGVGGRRFEVPHARELPRVRRAVVPLVRSGNALVAELVADRRPRLAAVVGALDQLTEPARRLRRVQPVRVNRRRP